MLRAAIMLAAAGVWAQTSASLPVSGVTPAASAPVIQTPIEALEQDAREYARQFGTTPGEAIWRLEAQQQSVAVTSQIAAAYRDRLVGIAIRHRPDYRIVVLLTGWAPVANNIVTAAGRQVPIDFQLGFPVNRAGILAAIVRHQAEIRAMLRDPPSMGIDQRTGSLVVMVSQADADALGVGSLTTDIEQLTGVPVTIRVLGRSEGNLVIAGGGRVESVDRTAGRRYACTAGFIVTDGRRDAITTAAHCPDNLEFIDIDKSRYALGYVGAWGAGFQDVQINASGGRLQPLFYADIAGVAVRRLASWRNRENTRAGDFVCHVGEHTGYSCGLVEYVDYAPAGDLCYGPCPPTWVSVAGPGCGPGDSGGPVFSTSFAFGILKGGSYQPDGRCNFYFYMSTDYLPTGWHLLH